MPLLLFVNSSLAFRVSLCRPGAPPTQTDVPGKRNLSFPFYFRLSSLSNGARCCEATVLMNVISHCLSFALFYFGRGGAGDLHICDGDNPHISKRGSFGGFCETHGEEIMQFCAFLQIMSV